MKTDHRWLALLFWLCWPLVPQAQALTNQLAGNASPYLAMHGQDPVAWQEWSPQILELAQHEGKLILVSSGYFSCHWCHVMHRESFSDAEIAATINQHFIPVKVDRELEAALDQYLLDFVQQTQGNAGWPLHVFLTPEGYPLVGLTYAPPKEFQRVLGQLARKWADERVMLTDTARRAVLALLTAQQRKPSGSIERDQLLAQFESAALRQADDLAGGFGQQSKFPMTAQLSLLIKLAEKKPGGAVDRLARLTLAQMADNGLRDQLGGGFFRYTVDPAWQMPHYEKMLYTQALMALLYLDAAQRLNEPSYLQVVTDTLDFVLREMRGADGGFVASLSAINDQGVEGGYYLWDRASLEELLSAEELRLAEGFWRMGQEQSSAGSILPLGGVPLAVLAENHGHSLGESEGLIQSARSKLLAARAQRTLPVDSKQLAGWNGLMLEALCKAAERVQRDDYRREAGQLKGFLVSLMKDGGLSRAQQNGRVIGSASLEDFALVAGGLSAWADISHQAEDRALANQVLVQAWARFHADAGWQSSSAKPLPGMAPSQAQTDQALPSSVATLLRLSLASGDSSLFASATAALKLALIEAASDPFWYPSLLQIEAKSGS